MCGRATTVYANGEKKMTNKEKLKEILKWCKINAKVWDPDQHDGPAEFKAICDLIEEKEYYKEAPSHKRQASSNKRLTNK